MRSLRASVEVVLGVMMEIVRSGREAVKRIMSERTSSGSCLGMALVVKFENSEVHSRIAGP